MTMQLNNNSLDIKKEKKGDTMTHKNVMASSMDSFYQSPDFSSFMATSNPDIDDNTLEAECSPAFFGKLFTTDAAKRKRAAEHCVEELIRNLYTQDFALVRSQIGRVVELANECPFEETRNIFANFLKEYNKEFQERNVNVPHYSDCITYFFAPESELSIYTESEAVREIFEEQFVATGRVSHVTRIMACHPELQEKFLTGLQCLLGNNEMTSLTTNVKHFLGLMGAARWKNAYLLKQQERFLSENGGADYLNGFTQLPKKLAMLLEFNAKMAEAPWKLCEHDFSVLVSGEDAWTVSEMVQIIVILSTFRGLAGFIFATGLNEELDYSHVPVKLTNSQNKSIVDNNRTMLDKMRLKLHSSSSRSQSPLEEGINNKKPSETENLALFQQAAHVEIVQPNIAVNYSNWSTAMEKKYGTHYNIQYSDFNFKDSKPLSIQEYNWSTHGYNEVANYFSREMADILEDTFAFTLSFTYSSFCTEKSVDTTPFRIAVWNYTHRLLGIFHDDYDYELVNVWLLVPTKQFIKKMVCCPSTITDADVLKLGFILPHEKIHLAFIIMEARREAELICCLRLVTKFTQSNSKLLRNGGELNVNGPCGKAKKSGKSSQSDSIFFRV